MARALGLNNPKVNTPPPETTFSEATLSIQEHIADKSGKHYDLRLAMQGTGVAHSWAIPQARMPAPGEKILAVESGDHDLSYMGFSGTLKSGYGKGRVTLKTLEKVEILESNANKVTFAQYTGSAVNRYTLVRIMGKDWLLLNTTATKETRPEIPQFKRKYPEISEQKIYDYTHNQDKLFAEKIDGAHVVIGLRPERRIDVFSYRPSSRSKKFIDHTFKTDLYKTKSPRELGKTTLRAELFAVDPTTKKPVVSTVTGGLLNSGTTRSREMQKSQGKLDHLIYDIDIFKGKDVSHLPYAQKLLLLKIINDKMPQLKMVKPSHSYVDKSNLLDDIKSGKHPLTHEGVVVYDLKKPTPEKYKITKDIDVYFHAPFSPNKGSRLERMGAAGGFLASREPGGEPVIRVGSGLSDELRIEIMKNPEAFKKRVAKIYIQDELPSGKVRMPILKEFRDYEMWNSKTASVVDPVQSTLCPDIFDLETGQVRPDVRTIILKGMQTLVGPETSKVTSVQLLGAIATYQWTTDGDIDINFSYAENHVPDKEEYALQQTRAKSYKDLIINGHPVQFTFGVRSAGNDSIGDTLSMYDLLENKWLKEPNPAGAGTEWIVDMNKSYLGLFRHILRSRLSGLLNAAQRGVSRESLLENAIGVSEAYKKIDRDRKLSYKTSFGVPNTSQANVVYKYLTDDPMICRLEEVYHAIKPKLLKGWYSY